MVGGRARSTYRFLDGGGLLVGQSGMGDQRMRETLSVVGLCLLWYLVSSSNNVVGKMLLTEFPYPMTVTMVQLLSITLYSGPFFNLWGVRRFAHIPWAYYAKFLVPLAFGKFMASVFTHVSLWKVPVSYAHTGEYPHTKYLSTFPP